MFGSGVGWVGDLRSEKQEGFHQRRQDLIVKMTWVVVFSHICYFHPDLGVSINREYPKWMVYNGKLYILKWDDLGVPLFSETSTWGNDPPTRFFQHFC